MREGHYSTDYVPLNIGFLAAYLKKYLDEETEVRLFNLPEKLELDVALKMPDILAVSNYAWNFYLSYLYISHYKSINPELICIMGGPNYPGRKDEQEKFLRKYSNIDFYVLMEGENAFLALVRKLIQCKLNINRSKEEATKGCQYLFNDKFVDGGQGERINDLDTIPSPYLEGFMDEFLDDGFGPMLQTNRGCPFGCKFCHSGGKYFNKLNQFSLERVLQEIDYIGAHVKSNVLSVTDDNFGILKRDKAIACKLANVRERNGWPAFISISTSKTNKEQVLDSIIPLRNAMAFSASLQSVNSETLENIKRKNLSLEEFRSMMDHDSFDLVYSEAELIMPLPGETRESHITAIRKVVDSTIESICSYTSMLLPNTPLLEDAFYDQFDMVKKFRVIPRDYGKYLGEKAIEVEQVCVATSTMSFEEYCDLRGLYFVVNSFYNKKAFKEIIFYLRANNISVFKWLENIKKSLENDAGIVGEIYLKFLSETKTELWDSEDELRDYYKNEENYNKLERGEEGANLIMKYSTLFFYNLNEFAKTGIDILLNTEKDVNEHFIQDLLKYCIAIRGNIFDKTSDKVTEVFQYDVEEWIKHGSKKNVDRFKKLTTINFVKTEEQNEIMDNYTSRYGSNEDARGKIMDQIGIENLFRKVENVCTV